MTTVRCPNCDATYHVDPAKLGGGGRKLKCAKCQTVWLATAEFVEEPPVVETVAAADMPLSREPAVEALPEAAPEIAPELGADGDAAYSPDSEDMLVQRNPGVDAVVKVGGWRQWVRGDNVWRSVAVGVVVLGLLAGAAVTWMKMGAAPHTPETEHADAVAEDANTPQVAMLADVVPPPEGIVLHRVRGDVSEVEGSNGNMALTVRGLLANSTSRTITVPPMRLELLGKDGNVADMWPVSGIAARMEGGAEEAWTVSLTAPDMTNIAGWRVVFVAE
ncbi:MAG: hypothetical protein EON60_09695 [Alphaproteobacteria bacterium]|nr:MAG: hypothetical protein EON60_09695 [Alphaproteobacteria bacterium]